MKQLETVQMTAAKKIHGCSTTTSNTVSREKLVIESKEHAKKEFAVNSWHVSMEASTERTG